ncbi:hypothetical protein [Streptomyces sirii]|uniref:hypothetical protein n=1 Tax=Streptomyces sirii TaxID=3127701 RepID=UPI003D35DB1C
MSVIQMFPHDEPLTLVPGETGPLIEFDVPIEPVPMFLRFIALWTDNTPLEGAAPTFGIKLGEGLITPVAADDTEVGIPGPKEGGTASCRRLPGDIYLLTVINHSESSTTWKLRIKNRADQTLRFVWVNSNITDDTFQPWMALDDQLSITGRSPVSFAVVRNWGPGTLTIEDSPGTPVGGQDSPSSSSTVRRRSPRMASTTWPSPVGTSLAAGNLSTLSKPTTTRPTTPPYGSWPTHSERRTEMVDIICPELWMIHGSR